MPVGRSLAPGLSAMLRWHVAPMWRSGPVRGPPVLGERCTQKVNGLSAEMGLSAGQTSGFSTRHRWIQAQASLTIHCIAADWAEVTGRQDGCEVKLGASDWTRIHAPHDEG